MVKLGDSRLELLEPLSEDSPVGRFLVRRGEGLHHVALRVPDIEARLDELKSKGVRLVSAQCSAAQVVICISSSIPRVQEAC